ncbi:hypothetical protein QA597_10610 [Marinilabiliaceae bacterium ANBcel2]|nr:hypothetical protein [Marinilabiliaceae bacterium ANBcel2]
MRNAWKVGMRFVCPEFMLNEEIAYAYGDSMPDYIDHSNIASVKPRDIIIMAKSVQDGIKHIGLVQSKPMFCIDEEIQAKDYLAKGIIRSENESLIEKFSNLEDHQDIVYFKVDWLKIETSELDVKFVNTKGFVSVKDNELLNETVDKYLNKR